jgi:hypothetical protein
VTRWPFSAALIFLVAACGSGKPTRSDWADGANAACRQALAEVEALKEPTRREEDAADLERFNEAGRRLDARLRRLTPSAGERDRAERMIQAYAAVIPVQERMARAIRRGDVAAIDQLVAQMQRLGSEGDRLALELGADECAKEAFDEEPDANVG